MCVPLAKLRLLPDDSRTEQFWNSLILEASRIDYAEHIPEITEQFRNVWSRHYAAIASLTRPTPPILEIGAGFGILAAGLGHSTGVPIWATEHPSRHYLFRSGYQNFLAKKGVHLVAHDLREGLPFCSESFATVYCCDVIEHLMPLYIIPVLHEISRVLAPGGYLVFSTPNLNRFSNFIRFIAGHSINPPLNVSKAGETFGHIRELAPKEMQALLRDVGLVTKKLVFGLNPYYTDKAFGEKNIFPACQAKTINCVTGILSWIIPSVGDGIYCLASKPI
jgi:SAM-dependent methyltransferase